MRRKEPLEMGNGRETKKQKTAEAKDRPWSRFQVDKVCRRERERALSASPFVISVDKDFSFNPLKVDYFR